ncbi:GHKL domain protein [Halobacteriovorax sp. BALOs_7]|uniref:ATP-binding protein n=1 Tax=Halobacteriovorax sp. BALOs_7 TaxID=2109558 RepID=UPI000EB63824|nr:ATP-binding protein [Halobacteriovorax sp. BALOs_7]AYF45212.1 GHKL domain protein [Halobacteriovorax sp. BALOs_7]
MSKLGQVEKIHVLKKIFTISQEKSGADYIRSLMTNIVKELEVDYIFVGRPSIKDPSLIVSDYAMAKGEFVEKLEYNLDGTPCSNVLTGRRVCIHASNVCSDFPEDELLQQMGVEAYVGAPVILPTGEFFGLLVILDTKVINEVDFFESAIELFASRVGVELAMIEANQSIKDLNNIVECQVKEKEEVIRKSHESLLEQEKLAALGRLTTGIAHEIRNPLNLVVNSSQIASSVYNDMKNGDYSDFKDLGKALDIIKTHSLRMKNILSIMLDNRNSGKRKYSIKKLIKESFKYAFHASVFKTEGIKLNFNHSSNISHDLHLFTNDIQFVFLNLFENSLQSLHNKFTGSDQEAELMVNTFEKDKYILIEVKDNGEGVPKDVLDKVFEPFFTTKSGVEGSGLGLSIVKSIVEKNEGDVFIESVPNEFTIVKIRFPKEISDG